MKTEEYMLYNKVRFFYCMQQDWKTPSGQFGNLLNFSCHSPLITFPKTPVNIYRLIYSHTNC